MPTKVIMPQLGESVVEGTVSRWLKNVGDPVQEYEPLLEVSTDKVDTEIPAPASGTLLEIVVQAGQTVERGVLLALIGAPDEQSSHDDELVGTGRALSEHVVSASAPSAQPVSAPASSSAPTHSNGSYTGHVTPVVARMAAEHHLDLSQIKGTGRDGRVTKKDVEAYLESTPVGTHVSSAVAEPELAPWERPGTGDLFKPSVDYGDTAPSTDSSVGTGRALSERIPSAPSSAPPQRLHPVEPIPTAASGELIPLSPMRKAIAEHMVRSKLHTSPHVTTVFEIDLSTVLAHREANKDAFARQGVNLTLTAYFAAATVTALLVNRYLNARWTDEGIYLHNAVHLGIAVALDDGLIVPVIKNAQDLNLSGLARSINDLSTRARSRGLKPDEVTGGTFSISNHGVSGSLFATPIINQPQVGILGVGVVEKRVKVINDAIAIRPCVYITLTFDHRVADGAVGDAFMMTLKSALENWK
jgi:pyruvate/2-oxoglutarate dehydrogenase complex dihydrolipoamide acyltransferase (E2) component